MYIMQHQFLAYLGSEIRLKLGIFSSPFTKNRKVMIHIEICMPKYQLGPVEGIWVFTQCHKLVK
jgi:hypothetical protein